MADRHHRHHHHHIAGDRGNHRLLATPKPIWYWVTLLFRFWIRLVGFSVTFSAHLALLLAFSCLFLSAKLLTRLLALFFNTVLFGLVKEKISKSKPLPSVLITAHHTSLPIIIHQDEEEGEREAEGKGEKEEDQREKKVLIPAMGLDNDDDDDDDDDDEDEDGETLEDSFAREVMKLHKNFLEGGDANISVLENEDEVTECSSTHIPPPNSIPLLEEQQGSSSNESMKMKLHDSYLCKYEDPTINVLGSSTDNDLVLTKISVYNEESAENEPGLNRKLSTYVSTENSNDIVEMQDADSTEEKPNSSLTRCSGAEIVGKNDMQNALATLDSVIERESIGVEYAGMQVERSSDDTIRMIPEYRPLKLEPNSSLMSSFMNELFCDEDESPSGIGSFRVNLVMNNDDVSSGNASVDISFNNEKIAANYIDPDSIRYSREVREGDDHKHTEMSYSSAPPHPMFTHEVGGFEDLLQKSSINIELKTTRSNYISERTSPHSMQMLTQDSVSKGEADDISTVLVDDDPSGGGQSIQESGKELSIDEDYESIELMHKYRNTIGNDYIDTCEKSKHDDESFCLTDLTGTGKAIQEGVMELRVETDYEIVECMDKHIDTNFCNYDFKYSCEKCKHGDDGDKSYGHLADVETLSANDTGNNESQDMPFYSAEGSICSNKVEYSVQNKDSVSSSSSRVCVRGHKLRKYLRIHRLGRRRRSNLHHTDCRHTSFLSLQNSVDELHKPAENLRSTSLIKGCSFLKFLPKTQSLPETVCISESASLDEDETSFGMEKVIINEIETVKTILGCKDVESSMPFTQQVEVLYKFAGMENLIRHPFMENHNDHLQTIKKKLELLKLVIGVK